MGFMPRLLTVAVLASLRACHVLATARGSKRCWMVENQDDPGTWQDGAGVVVSNIDVSSGTLLRLTVPSQTIIAENDVIKLQCAAISPAALGDPNTFRAASASTTEITFDAAAVGESAITSFSSCTVHRHWGTTWEVAEMELLSQDNSCGGTGASETHPTDPDRTDASHDGLCANPTQWSGGGGLDSLSKTDSDGFLATTRSAYATLPMLGEIDATGTSTNVVDRRYHGHFAGTTLDSSGSSAGFAIASSTHGIDTVVETLPQARDLNVDTFEALTEEREANNLHDTSTDMDWNQMSRHAPDYHLSHRVSGDNPGPVNAEQADFFDAGAWSPNMAFDDNFKSGWAAAKPSRSVGADESTYAPARRQQVCNGQNQPIVDGLVSLVHTVTLRGLTSGTYAKGQAVVQSVALPVSGTASGVVTEVVTPPASQGDVIQILHHIKRGQYKVNDLVEQNCVMETYNAQDSFRFNEADDTLYPSVHDPTSSDPIGTDFTGDNVNNKEHAESIDSGPNVNIGTSCAQGVVLEASEVTTYSKKIAISGSSYDAITSKVTISANRPHELNNGDYIELTNMADTCLNDLRVVIDTTIVTDATTQFKFDPSGCTLADGALKYQSGVIGAARKSFIATSIDFSNPALLVVTTSTAHGLSDGDKVQLVVDSQTPTLSGGTGTIAVNGHVFVISTTTRSNNKFKIITGHTSSTYTGSTAGRVRVSGIAMPSLSFTVKVKVTHGVFDTQSDVWIWGFAQEFAVASSVATIKTQMPHSLIVGDSVEMIGFSSCTQLNAVHTVTSITKGDQGYSHFAVSASGCSNSAASAIFSATGGLHQSVIGAGVAVNVGRPWIVSGEGLALTTDVVVTQTSNFDFNTHDLVTINSVDVGVPSDVVGYARGGPMEATHSGDYATDANIQRYTCSPTPFRDIKLTFAAPNAVNSLTVGHAVSQKGRIQKGETKLADIYNLDEADTYSEAKGVVKSRGGTADSSYVVVKVTEGVFKTGGVKDVHWYVDSIANENHEGFQSRGSTTSQVTACSSSSTVYTITTHLSHGLDVGRRFVLTGFDNEELNGPDHSFIVSEVTSATVFKFDSGGLTTEGCPSFSASSVNPRVSGEWADDSAQQVPFSSVDIVATPISAVSKVRDGLNEEDRDGPGHFDSKARRVPKTTLTITTPIAHHLEVGDSFVLTGFNDYRLNAGFQVTQVTSATVFVFDTLRGGAPSGFQASDIERNEATNNNLGASGTLKCSCMMGEGFHSGQWKRCVKSVRPTDASNNLCSTGQSDCRRVCALGGARVITRLQVNFGHNVTHVECVWPAGCDSTANKPYKIFRITTAQPHWLKPNQRVVFDGFFKASFNAPSSAFTVYRVENTFQILVRDERNEFLAQTGNDIWKSHASGSSGVVENFGKSVIAAAGRPLHAMGTKHTTTSTIGTCTWASSCVLTGPAYCLLGSFVYQYEAASSFGFQYASGKVTASDGTTCTVSVLGGTLSATTTWVTVAEKMVLKGFRDSRFNDREWQVAEVLNHHTLFVKLPAFVDGLQGNGCDNALSSSNKYSCATFGLVGMGSTDFWSVGSVGGLSGSSNIGQAPTATDHVHRNQGYLTSMNNAFFSQTQYSNQALMYVEDGEPFRIPQQLCDAEISQCTASPGWVSNKVYVNNVDQGSPIELEGMSGAYGSCNPDGMFMPFCDVTARLPGTAATAVNPSDSTPNDYKKQWIGYDFAPGNGVVLNTVEIAVCTQGFDNPMLNNIVATITTETVNSDQKTFTATFAQSWVNLAAGVFTFTGGVVVQKSDAGSKNLRRFRIMQNKPNQASTKLKVYWANDSPGDGASTTRSKCGDGGWNAAHTGVIELGAGSENPTGWWEILLRDEDGHAPITTKRLYLEQNQSHINLGTNYGDNAMTPTPGGDPQTNSAPREQSYSLWERFKFRDDPSLWMNTPVANGESPNIQINRRRR